MPTYANRVAGFGTTIFAEINNLALRYGAVNLGQGRPDFDGPREVVEAAVRALQSGSCNQYAPVRGIPELTEGIASHAAAFYNMNVDPENGVLVTPGATEAIFCSIMGLIDPGEEVIVIEPFYDSYVPGLEMAGATPVFVSLHPPDWIFDPDELRAAFNERTRAIIINTPNNPTGRVFTLAELELIAGLCRKHDVIVISDEVYEHLLFDDARHIPIASLPGMFERTVTVGQRGQDLRHDRLENRLGLRATRPDNRRLALEPVHFLRHESPGPGRGRTRLHAGQQLLRGVPGAISRQT